MATIAKNCIVIAFEKKVFLEHNCKIIKKIIGFDSLSDKTGQAK
jgi:hypothetical protein